MGEGQRGGSAAGGAQATDASPAGEGLAGPEDAVCGGQPLAHAATVDSGPAADASGALSTAAGVGGGHVGGLRAGTIQQQGVDPTPARWAWWAASTT